MAQTAGQVSLVGLIKKLGFDVTRENYIGVAYFNNPPVPWTAEDEERLPEEFQDWSKFEEKGGQAVYVGDHHPGYVHNPNHVPAGSPEGGQFTSSGGGGATEGKKPDEGKKPTERPKVIGDGKNVDKVQKAIDSLPQEHLDLIGDKLKAVTNVDVIHVKNQPGFHPLGLARYQGDDNIFIQVADQTERYTDFGKTRMTLKNADIEGVAVHEMGHALDVATGKKWSPSVSEQVWQDAYDPYVGMSSDELQRSAHYLSNEREMFAELYRTIYSPSKRGGFGMDQQRAEQVFKKSIKHMRKILK